MRLFVRCTLLILLSSFGLNAQDCPDSCDIYVPNNITPDNDCFDCHYLTVTSNCTFNSFHLKIYNRWGEVLFESDDPEHKFSSQDVKEGSYTWRVDITFCNEISLEKSGIVNVLK